MPDQSLVISLAVELVLMSATLFLLAHPRMLFKPRTDRARLMITISGLVFLCLTFCWSVIFGCVIALHEPAFRI